MTCPIIYEFREENFFLSNFAEVYISVPIPQLNAPPLVENYTSVENAYQALKSEDPEERKRFQPLGYVITDPFNPTAEPVYRTMTASEAKKFGRMLTLRKSWNSVQVGIMVQLIALKFSDPAMKAKLQATRPKMIIEGNYWHDNFWGVCFCPRPDCRGACGLNRLGQILMNQRESR